MVLVSGMRACFNQWCLVRTGTPHTNTLCNVGCAVVLCCDVLCVVSSCRVLYLYHAHVYPVFLKGEAHSLVTIECAGVLPCSIAAETVTHIEKTWERGQVAPAPLQRYVLTTKQALTLFLPVFH